MSEANDYNMKRYLFILLSIVLASTNFWIYFVPGEARNYVLLATTATFSLAAVLFIKLTLTKVPLFPLLIPPIVLTLGLGAVGVFFPNLNLAFRVALWVAGSFSFYITLLSLNVFAVVIEQDVHLPLLRAVVTSSSLILNVALFLIFVSVYKVETIFAIQALLVFLITYITNRFYFWAASVESKFNFEKEAFVGALVTFEIALATSFIPLESFFRAFLLISVVYVVDGLLLSRLQHRLNRRVVSEYVMVLGVVIALLVAFNV